MNKIVLTFASVLAVALMGTASRAVVLAQEPTADIEVEVTPEAQATPVVSVEAEAGAEVKAESPGILPTNPFYFIKKFGWTIRRVFTFNPVNKVKLELDIADQRAAEIKKLSEVSEDEGAIVKAAANYEEHVDRLTAKLEALKETSANPNVDKLLDRVLEKSLKQQERFQDLKAKHEALKEKFESAKEKLDEVVAKVSEKEADPEKFKNRLDKALDKEKQGIIKEIKKAEIFERIEGKVTDDVLREKLMRIKDDVAGEATLRVKAEIQAPTINVNVYFRELLDRFDIESASITEDYARLLFEIARKIINYAEQNLTKVTSLTDETPAAMVARARALLAEAERAQSAGDINLAWNKLREVTSALRGLRFPESERKLPSADIIKPTPNTTKVPVAPSDTRRGGGSDDDSATEPAGQGGGGSVIAEPILPMQAAVRYASGKFNPQVVKVKRGGTVTFVNSSAESFWPASGVHPTHEIYPEFDAREAIPAGASWSFTFDEDGTWRYHNHLNPGAVGAVVVE